ncbi:hypothetical protein TNCV_2726861 [Trichonephila clavipes]|nr:hypothetical protein TNCV_2726861 [Trichonephila clavipes]
MAPSKAKDPELSESKLGKNPPLNLKRSALFFATHPRRETTFPLLRILMQLQNVLSLGSKEESSTGPVLERHQRRELN